MTDIVLKNISDNRIYLDILTSLLNRNIALKEIPILGEVIFKCNECERGYEFACLNCSVSVNYLKEGKVEKRDISPFLKGFNEKALVSLLTAIAALPSPTFEDFMDILKQVRPLVLQEAEEAKQEASHDPTA